MGQILQENDIQRLTKQLSDKIALSIHYSAVNLGYCRQIIHAQLSGRIVLPHRIGLDKITYQNLRKVINDDELVHQELAWYKDDWLFMRERAEFCGELFAMKKDERSELINLLSLYRNQQDPSSQQMAIIIATASLTKHHLWESLGLQERSHLGEIIKHNFPELHALNTDNMRWKRFFYRQLCEQGGDYLCRAPSCDECKSYAECFA
jgi:nitrogen fixation protein NifQ